MRINPSIFKAYDIRGIYGTDITPHIAYVIARAYARVIKPEPKKVALGRDVRTHGQELFPAVVKGLQDEGITVVDLGVISTDMLYFAVAKYALGGGITISASHNPREYNGFKMVRSGAVPISGDTGIKDIAVEAQALMDELGEVEIESTVKPDEEITNFIDAYIDDLFRVVPITVTENTPRLRIAFNANHGPAGEVVKKIIERHSLPVDIEPYLMEMNGEFPQGRPDPMYAENRVGFGNHIVERKADVGIAWDADADRCFFFDHTGACVDGYHTSALLADMVLAECNEEGACIIHDPRLTWAVTSVADKHGAVAHVNKVGHSFIKERMRKEDAVFAGENSGHYYFRDFYYADNGMIPFLLLLRKLLSQSETLHDMVDPLRTKFPISGEINLSVTDTDGALETLKGYYSDVEHESIDGLSIAYPEWRANIRASNTEPILRVNVEAKTSELVSKKTAEILGVLDPYCR